MKVIGIRENDHYAGFTLTGNIEEEIDNYSGTTLQVIVLADTNDESIARNLVDYFTMAPNASPEGYGITDGFVLTADGEDLWDALNQ